jgi:hypothetical protein
VFNKVYLREPYVVDIVQLLPITSQEGFIWCLEPKLACTRCERTIILLCRSNIKDMLEDSWGCCITIYLDLAISSVWHCRTITSTYFNTLRYSLGLWKAILHRFTMTPMDTHTLMGTI